MRFTSRTMYEVRMHERGPLSWPSNWATVSVEFETWASADEYREYWVSLYPLHHVTVIETVATEAWGDVLREAEAFGTGGWES